MAQLRWRFVAAVVVLIAAAGVAPALAWSRLPGQVAVHWGIHGRPDTFVSRPWSIVVTSGLTLVVIVVALLFHRFAGGRPVARAVEAFVMFFAALFAAITVMVMVMNAASAAPARIPPVLGLALVAVALLVVLVVYGKSFAGRGVGGLELRSAGDEHIRWRGTAHARWPLMVGALFAVAAALVAVMWNVWLGGVLIVPALAAIALAGIEVVVDDAGMAVRYFGGLRWPASRIRREEIREVAAIDVRPAQYGGWGYRGSLRLLDKAAVNLRSGPGLRLELTGGKVFVVTVDDAEQGERSLRSLLQTV